MWAGLLSTVFLMTRYPYIAYRRDRSHFHTYGTVKQSRFLLELDVNFFRAVIAVLAELAGKRSRRVSDEHSETGTVSLSHADPDPGSGAFFDPGYPTKPMLLRS
jgi:hypothetical protein